MTNATRMKPKIETILPLSPLQQGLLFHALYESDSRLYFDQLSCLLEGELDPAAFRRAWGRVAQRHQAFRTAFSWRKTEKLLQVVLAEVALQWREEDWRRFTREEQALRLEQFLEADRRQGFDPAKPPLMRFALARCGRGRFHFVWSFHHLVLDGWSVPIVVREVMHLYEEEVTGVPTTLSRPRPFADYIAWTSAQDLREAERFWRAALQGFAAATPLRFGGGDRAADESGSTGEESSHLSEERTRAVVEASRAQQVTVNTVVQGAWALLLGRYSGATDVVFGATVSGRPAELEGVEQMVGLFINTLPVRVRMEEAMGVGEWLRELQRQQVELRQYEYSPLAEVQRWSELAPGTPLFESIVTFQNFPIDEAANSSTRFRILRADGIERTNYPISIVAGLQDRIWIQVFFDMQRFTRPTVRHILAELAATLEEIAVNARGTLGDLLKVLEEGQRRARREEDERLVAASAERLKAGRRRVVYFPEQS